MKRMCLGWLVGLLVFGTACSETTTNPAVPGTTGVSAAVQPDMLPDSHGHRLTAVVGEGEGLVNVSPEASAPGLDVEVEVSVWRTSPNTTFRVKRASDMTTTGVCTSTNFVQFPLPNPGPLATITTSEGGAGSTHIKFDRPSAGDEAHFAVRYEVSTADLSIVLRTGCFTVAGK